VTHYLALEKGCLTLDDLYLDQLELAVEHGRGLDDRHREDDEIKRRMQDLKPGGFVAGRAQMRR